jgi:hypothetical protein
MLAGFLFFECSYPEDHQARAAERDARIAADTRTECQKVLGDPPRESIGIGAGPQRCGAGARSGPAP